MVNDRIFIGHAFIGGELSLLCLEFVYMRLNWSKVFILDNKQAYASVYALTVKINYFLFELNGQGDMINTIVIAARGIKVMTEKCMSRIQTLSNLLKYQIVDLRVQF